MLEARRVSVELFQDNLYIKHGTSAQNAQFAPFCKGHTAVVDVASLVSGLRNNKIDASAVEIAIPTTNDDAERTKSRKYTPQAMLELRSAASAHIPAHIPAEVRRGNAEEACDGKGIFHDALHDEKLVFSPNRKANKKVISFHTELQVDASCTVNVFNLASNVEWPNLQTFCTKTVGITPVTIRMMRRSVPAQALIVFSSQQEAFEFVKQVPSDVKLKGRKPRFELSKAAQLPRGTRSNPVAAPVAKDVDGFVATAVVCEE